MIFQCKEQILLLRNKHEKERFWYGNLSFWMNQKLKLLTKEGIVIVVIRFL